MIYVVDAYANARDLKHDLSIETRAFTVGDEAEGYLTSESLTGVIFKVRTFEDTTLVRESIIYKVTGGDIA